MSIKGRYPKVYEYYPEHIDSSVNLAESPKQCCPFHKEEKPSFSYDPRTDRWTCFGKCHMSGGVKEMHQRKYGFTTLAEADESLQSLYEIPKTTTFEAIKNKELMISESKVESASILAEACRLANNPSRWLELDLVMSKTPVDLIAVKLLSDSWKGIKCVLRSKEYYDE